MDIYGTTETKLRRIKTNKHLENSLYIIYGVGLWPEWAKRKYLYKLYRIFYVVVCVGAIFISGLAYVVMHLNDLTEMSTAATMLMTYSAFVIKILYFFCRHDRIKELLDITNSEIFTRDNDKYERIVTYYTWQGIFHHILYQCVASLCIFCLASASVHGMISGISRELPFAGWYPYNVTASPYYEITCAHYFATLGINCMANVATDTFITGLMITTCCQLKLLNRNLSSMRCANKDEPTTKYDIDSETKSGTKSSDELYEDLKLYIEHTETIFDFAKQIQDIFGPSMFYQLFINSINVCLIAFNISQMTNYLPLDLFGMLLYMCSMLYQLFIYYWQGNELYLHSLDVCLHAYANNWWRNSEKFKQALLIIMTRAQTPIRLTVGSIMELSLQNFLSILRMSYSIFSVLKTSMVGEVSS